jgi:hypothetical protein
MPNIKINIQIFVIYDVAKIIPAVNIYTNVIIINGCVIYDKNIPNRIVNPNEIIIKGNAIAFDYIVTDESSKLK